MDSLYPHAQNDKLPTTSGIYKITCAITEKIYIGSAVNLRKRRNEHINKLRKNKHDNQFLQNVWNKYGEESLVFEVLELVLVPEMLTAREQYWFDLLRPFPPNGYNLAPFAGSRLGYPHTPETREKIRQAGIGNKNGVGKNLGNKNGVGYKHTAEAREKISQSHKGMGLGNKNSFGRKLSPETIEKVRQTHLGKGETPEAIENMRKARWGDGRDRTVSPETREKMRQSHLGKKRSSEAIEKARQTNLAKKRAGGRAMVTVAAEQLNPVCIGIDVGQVTDPTALAVAEAIEKHTGKYRQIEPVRAHYNERGQWIPPRDAEPLMKTEYFIRTIRRLPLGTSYPKVAEHIADLLCSPLLARRQVRLLIDVTGVGRPVYDDLRTEARLRKEARTIKIQPISFVRGETYNRKTGVLGKAFLVSRLQSLFQSGRVHGPDTPEMTATVEELRVYEIKVDNDGTDTYGAKIGKHDDLAVALGLAVLEDPFGDRITYSKRVY